MMTRIAPTRWKFFKAAMMKSPSRAIKCALLLHGLMVSASAGALDSNVKQFVLSVAPGWDSTKGRLQCFERRGSEWRAVSAAWPVLYGKSGLAWGRGILGADEPGLRK